MLSIPIISGATLPTDPPGTGAAASAFETSSGANVLEITVAASAGSGDLVLLRWFGGLGEWRPWKEDRPIAADSAAFGGYSSASYVLAMQSSAHWMLWDAGGALTAEAHASEVTVRGAF